LKVNNGAGFAESPHPLALPHGSQQSLNNGGCVTGNAAYFTNMTATSGETFDFMITGGAVGALYDIFSTTNILGNSVSNTA